MRLRWAAWLGVLAACQPTSEVEQRDPVAAVHGHTLYWDEVSAVVPDEATPEDSALLADRYIQQWITDQALVQQAQNVLPERLQDFEEALEKHRQALLTHAYEEEMIRQRLDTAVAESELRAFYDQNRDNFVLKDYIVQARFCMLDSGDWDATAFRTQFEQVTDDTQEELETFCHQYRGGCFLDEDQWIFLEDLRQQVPLEIYNTERFLKKNKTVEVQRGNQVIFLRIRDFKLKDSVSPFSLQKAKIRSMILNRRKSELLSTLRADVYRQALKENQIEMHYERP